jgi:hypothetical protein
MTQIKLITCIGFNFLFYILQFISSFYNSSLTKIKTNKNSIKINKTPLYATISV